MAAKDNITLSRKEIDALAKSMSHVDELLTKKRRIDEDIDAERNHMFDIFETILPADVVEELKTKSKKALKQRKAGGQDNTKMLKTKILQKQKAGVKVNGAKLLTTPQVTKREKEVKISAPTKRLANQEKPKVSVPLPLNEIYKRSKPTVIDPKTGKPIVEKPKRKNEIMTIRSPQPAVRKLIEGWNQSAQNGVIESSSSHQNMTKYSRELISIEEYTAKRNMMDEQRRQARNAAKALALARKEFEDKMEQAPKRQKRVTHRGLGDNYL